VLFPLLQALTFELLEAPMFFIWLI